MKSPSLQQFFLLSTILFFSVAEPVVGQVVEYPYEQSFEGAFSTGSQQEFLPGWWGNAVSNGRSRIYQAGAAESLSGQWALGVTPTASFSGDIRVRFDASSLETGEVSFWARSGRNGSGSRPAILHVSFSADGGESFTEQVQVGGSNTFPNEDTEYHLYQFTLPEEVLGSSAAMFRLQVTRGSGEGSVARVLIDDFVISKQPLSFRLLSAKALNQHQVELHFNKKLDKGSAENEANYQITPATEIMEARVDEANGRKLILETSPLQAEAPYSLRLGKVLDEEGNSAEGQESSFVWRDAYEPAIYDLLISEIHAAPNESTLLPNVEWIEVYNASGRSIQLEGMQFADESRSVILPAYILEAGGHLVLAPAANSDLLEGYGPVLGLSAWPNLNNDGDVLSLYSFENRLIDRVAYQQSWYGSSQKSSGGWSLERIDLENPCIGAPNWTASMAIPGGSPGQANSVASSKPDNTGPELLLAFVLDSVTVQLVMNEALDTTQFAAARIDLQPSVVIDRLMPMPDNPERFKLKLAEPLRMDVQYELTLSNLQDCSGNLMENPSNTELAYPRTPGAGDVVFNEVMFDPPPNSEEWVEIANATAHYLNLQNWQVATWDNGIKATAVLSREHLILPPGGVLAMSKDPGAVKVAFPSAPVESLLTIPLPVLANTGDTLVLIDSGGELVDKFGYHQNMHSPFVREPKGVSLERINLSASSLASDNWTSAASEVNYGTPGLPNSQRFRGRGVSEEQLLIKPGVIRPGSAAPTGYATILFHSDRAGLQLTLIIYDTEGRTIRTLAHNQLIGVENYFTWDGTDEDSRSVRTGYYIVFLRVLNAEGYKKEFKKVLVVGK